MLLTPRGQYDMMYLGEFMKHLIAVLFIAFTLAFAATAQVTAPKGTVTASYQVLTAEASNIGVLVTVTISNPLVQSFGVSLSYTDQQGKLQTANQLVTRGYSPYATGTLAGLGAEAYTALAAYNAATPVLFVCNPQKVQAVYAFTLVTADFTFVFEALP